MPRPHSSNSPEVLRGTHDCPKCGFPMLLAIIEPSEKDGHDRRIFECLLCNHVETVEVKFR